MHLRHLLAPFPFWRSLIPFGVAMLRCISFALARMKNSRRILAHLHPEIVLYHIRQGLTRGKFAKNAKSSAAQTRSQAQVPSVTIKIKKHGSALRRGQGGDRKAPLSRPQARFPLQQMEPSNKRKKGCRSSTDKQHPRLLIPFSPDAESRFSFSPPLFSAGRKDKSRDAAAPP